MIRRKFVLKLSIFIIYIVNVNLTRAQSSDPALTPTAQCPPNYELRNGLCYYIGARRCPEGYHFHTDGLCYPIEQKPCPFETTTTSAPITTSTSTTTSTTAAPLTTSTTTPAPITTTSTTTPLPTTTSTTTPAPITTTSTTTPLPTTTSTTTPAPITTTSTTTPVPTTTQAPTTTLEQTTSTTTTTPKPTTTTTTELTTTTSTTTPLPPTTSSSTAMPPITITTSSPPIMDEYVRCPPGSIFIEDKCRKIICSLGEYYKGHCLQPACPQGLVWRRKSCQEPGYITTILEIENVIVNQINEQPLVVERSNTDKIIYHTTTSTTRKPCVTSAPATVRPTKNGPYITTSTKPATTIKDSPQDYGCCTVVTPRICKMYGEKWVCFNRRHKRCDSRICTAPIVYLKAPEIKYDPPVLIMPPNPPLNACSGNNCNNTDDVIDCSGCAKNHPEQCSSYCYRYMCPIGACVYMDLDTYCSYYAGQFGCLKEDGCLWNWC